MADTTATDIPAIQSFQFEAEAIGALSKSVNLFRGDVNHSQTLLTLPGRPGRKELSASLTVLYQSNVHDDVTGWNLEAPTGVVGLGWDLPLEYVFAASSPVASSATRAYYWQSAGIPTRLVRQPQVYDAPLFTSTAIGAGDLQGPGVNIGLRQVFAGHGVRLSGNGTVTLSASGSWSVADTEAERLFTVTQDGSTFTVFDAGESYQLQSFRFWRITYYPVFERWQIVKDTGVTASYGGGIHTTSRGYRAGQGNSVAWRVRWGNWSGNSSVTGGQSQQATAWHLTWIGDRWGDRVRYDYNGWPNEGGDGWQRDTETDLIPAVEQRVGFGQTAGLPFTKAVYLTAMTDVFGRRVSLEYAEKIYTDPTTSPAGPREYQDPHKPVAANATTPNSFQDPVATKYLDRVVVTSGAGIMLLTVEFTYALANVTSTTGALHGDTFKRYLRSITQHTADGDHQPGLRFDYYTKPDDVHPGALMGVTYPTGATATYQYVEQSLPICARRLPVAAPDNHGSWTPRVFFGPDYAVVLWYANNSGRLSMTAYTWMGRWLSWQPAAGPTIYDNQLGLDVAHLEVLAGAEQFALSFPAQTGDDAEHTFLYLFRKDPSQMGQWLELDHDGHGWITFDSPSVSLAAGDSFVVAVEPSATTTSYQLWRYTWDWTQRRWVVPAQPVAGSAANVVVTAGREYYLLAGYTLGQADTVVALSHVDALGAWHDSPPRADPDLVANYSTGIFLTPAASFVAAAVETQQSPTNAEYTLAIYQWDESYALAKATGHRFTQDVRRGGHQASIVPLAPTNSLVVCGENILRFDGAAWQLNKTLQIENPAAASEDAWYAAGDDFVLQTVPSRSNFVPPACLLLAYDPDRDAAGWAAKEASLPQPPLRYRPQDPGTANFPTASGSDWFTSDRNVYYRGLSPDWAAGAAQPLFSVPDDLDTKAIVDQGPDFIAYTVPDADRRKSLTQVLVLRNGIVATTETLTGEKYWTADEATSAVGRYPAGPGSFVTYDATVEAFDDAPSFTLYRFSGESIVANLIHHPVACLTIDDGFGHPQATAYHFDPAAAACDSSAAVVKYYKSTTYPGTKTALEAPFGRAETSYVNGYQGGAAPYAYMLDGTLERVLTYNSEGTLVASEWSTWAVYTGRNRSPAVPDTTPLLLSGGYARAVSQVHTSDGVATTTTRSYVPAGFEFPFSGQEVASSVDSHDGAGNQQTQTTRKTYAYEVYPDLVGQNTLTPVAQTTKLVSVNGAPPVTTGMSASDYLPWPTQPDGPASVQVLDVGAGYAWRGGQVADFPFSSTPDPAVWLRTSTVVHRSTAGLATETSDAVGTRSSVLYDRAQEFPVAAFANASLSGGEATYYGFEPYMDPAGWAFGGGAAIVAGDARTGDSSLQLPAHGEGWLRVGLTPARQSQRYSVSCWYKTGPTFKSDGQSGVTVTVTVAGTRFADPIFLPFVDSAGRWSRLLHTFDLTPRPSPPLGAARTLGVSATNTSPAAVLVDDVCVAPFPSTATWRTFDTDRSLLLSETALDGVTKRHLYDPFQRKMGVVGPAEQVRTLCGQFASRQGNGGVFSAADPNATVQIDARSGGSAEGFRSGDEWQARWTPTGTWVRDDGALRHPAGTAATLTLVPACFSAAFALYFELAWQAPVTDAVGIELGDGDVVSWQPSAGAWACSLGGRQLSPLARPATVARQWLLIGDPRSLLFYADGQLIFSRVLAGQPASGLQIFTGANQLALRHLAVVRDPVVQVAYHDAAGRTRQTHRLHDADSLVTQVIFDAAGRGVVATKAAPGSAGAGAHAPLCAYRSSFVDVAAFLATLDSSGVMHGDVADYWRGQTEPTSGLPRADDDGYPYSRKRYEASPLDRVVEMGAPGKDHAIVGSTNPNTVSYSYRPSVAGDVPGVPPEAAAQYRVVTHVNPSADGSGQATSSLRIDDANGALVALGMPLPNEPGGDVMAKTVTTYGPSGRQVTGCLPNFYQSPVVAGQDRFVTVESYDLLGRLVRRQEPNTGVSRAMYDDAGRLRFSQVNQEASAPADRYISYWKYDVLGREVESGTCPYDWNDTSEAALRARAADPIWPYSPALVQCVRSYDGDGREPHSLGKLVEVVRTNVRSRGTVTATEQYRYDERGQVVDATLLLVGAGPSASASVGYQYDNLGQVAVVTYPEAGATGVPQVTYRYDSLGRTVQIGASADDPARYAAYAYDAAGNIVARTLGGGGVRSASSYLSPGWLGATSITAAGLTATSGHRYWPNGSLQTISRSVRASGTSDDHATSYWYDPIQRLTRADDSAHPGWNLTVSRYDPNGNINALCAGGKENAPDYLPGTDQLSGIEHDQFGHVQATSRLQLAYEPGIGLTSQITVGGSDDVVVFDYNGMGKRVVKEVVRHGAVASSTSYVHGIHPLPFVEVQNDGTATAYIYGPEGLVAARSDRLYLVLKDHEGSVRYVLDSSGGLAAGYDYLPFGGLARSYGPNPGVVPYLYTGQEFDTETGLYNYRARLYDSALRRFYAPDPKRQFASPYVYVGDDPIMAIDPSGMSILDDLTKGVSDFFSNTIVKNVVSFVVDAALIAAGIAVLATTPLGGAASTLLGSTLLGAGIGGLTYNITALATHQQFSWRDWGIQLGVGGAAGLISGGFAAGGGALVGASAEATGGLLDFSGSLGQSTFMVGGAGRFAVNTVVGGVVGNAVSGFSGALLNNVATHTSLWTGVGFATVLGGVLGGAGALSTEGGAAALSKTPRLEGYDEFPVPGDWGEERAPFRYVPETRWNNTMLAIPGSIFTALFGASNAVWDAAGWPNRF